LGHTHREAIAGYWPTLVLSYSTSGRICRNWMEFRQEHQGLKLGWLSSGKWDEIRQQTLQLASNM